MKSYIYGAKPLDMLAILIGLALAGAVGHFIFFAPAKLQHLDSGWDSAMEPAGELDRFLVEEAPQKPALPAEPVTPQPPVQMPEFNLGQLPAIQFEQKPKEYRWEIQEYPCDDRAQLGSHWSGADCMYHCLIYD